MKRVYLIHSWKKKEKWFDWLEEKLKSKGIWVKSFDMPDILNPKIEDWVKFLEENIKEVDEETYFVGHSIGAQTIMRFLEKLPKHKGIGGCVFVAPWFRLMNLNEEEMRIAHPWMNSKIDFERITRHTSNILALFSNNDPYVHLDEADKFKENLGAKIITKENARHFDDVEEIPEIFNFLEK
jgi:predicted alpha/beta hydrolase family esterase